MKKMTLFALAAGWAMAAGAQTSAPASVGVLSDVAGSVTVSSTQAVKRAVNGMQVSEGASILVASEAKATLVMNNGCVISLKDGEHLTVNSAQKCDEVQAAVKQLFPAFKVAQAPTTGPSAYNFDAKKDEGDRKGGLVGWNSNNTIAAITAGVIGVVALTSGGGSSTPVSPQ